MTIAAPFVLPSLMARLRTPPTTPPPPPPPPPEGGTAAGIVPAPAATPTPPSSPSADPELAMIGRWVEELREDLTLTREALEESQRRHREEVSILNQRLDERERMIARLEATIDLMTGRVAPSAYPPPVPAPPAPWQGRPSR